MFNAKYFWSSSVRWKKQNGRLKIEIYNYSKVYAELFPDFYYYTQDGITDRELYSKFKDQISEEKLDLFLKDLKKKKILVSSILSPAEIFYPQALLLEGSNDEDLLINNELLAEFKSKQLNRCYAIDKMDKIKLEECEELPEFISKRRSKREFDTDKQISFKTFCKLCATYKQTKEQEVIKYNYASAGGLYPIDAYYYIKPERVEGIEGGLYYYSPIDNTLNLVERELNQCINAHYYGNKQIYESSAFSIFYFYNGKVSMPKYGGMGYYYGLIDLGIMIQTYTIVAQVMGISVCSIGEMNFEIIKEAFQLKNEQVYLHTIEVGV